MNEVATPSLPDYYEVLQVSPNADHEFILTAYKRLLEKWQADRKPGDPTEFDKLTLIDKAHAILSNPIKRKEYDLQKCQPIKCDLIQTQVPSENNANPIQLNEADSDGKSSASHILFWIIIVVGIIVGIFVFLIASTDTKAKYITAMVVGIGWMLLNSPKKKSDIDPQLAARRRTIVWSIIMSLFIIICIVLGILGWVRNRNI